MIALVSLVKAYLNRFASMTELEFCLPSLLSEGLLAVYILSECLNADSHVWAMSGSGFLSCKLVSHSHMFA